MDYYIVYITTSNLNEAKYISKELLEKKLIACANIIENMLSIFNWNGKLQENNETVLILKTKESKLDQVIQQVKHLHSYECPCIISFKIKNGNVDFLNWIDNETE